MLDYPPRVAGLGIPEIDNAWEPYRGGPAVRVLVVENDVSLRTLIADHLEHSGVSVTIATSATDVARRLSSLATSFILLDLQFGREDGLDTLRMVRAAHDTPVIIMTGHRSDEVDRVVGLELGADDHLLKPPSLCELVARIRVVLRRGVVAANTIRREQETRMSRFGFLVLKRKTRQLMDGGGCPVPLTKGEYALLTAFTEQPLVATRVHEDILDRSIDVQILRLRRKLEAHASAPRIIRTERGARYVFDIDVERVHRG